MVRFKGFTDLISFNENLLVYWNVVYHKNLRTSLFESRYMQRDNFVYDLFCGFPSCGVNWHLGHIKAACKDIY